MKTSIALGNSFVAFLDILGFSEMVEADCKNGPLSKTPNLDNLYQVHYETIKQLSGKNEIQITQFSDSVVFSRSFDTSIEVFNEFLEVIRGFQHRLFLRGLLCRGGVSYGKHFEEGAFLFSKGLINAYKIESSMARFPRVVIDDNLLQLLCPSQNELSKLPLIKADDDSLFIDYLSLGSQDDAFSLMKYKWDVAKNSEAAIREKVLWLARYYDFVFGKETKSPIAPERFTTIN